MKVKLECGGFEHLVSQLSIFYRNKSTHDVGGKILEVCRLSSKKALLWTNCTIKWNKIILPSNGAIAVCVNVAHRDVSVLNSRTSIPTRYVKTYKFLHLQLHHEHIRFIINWHLLSTNLSMCMSITCNTCRKCTRLSVCIRKYVGVLSFNYGKKKQKSNKQIRNNTIARITQGVSPCVSCIKLSVRHLISTRSELLYKMCRPV